MARWDHGRGDHMTRKPSPIDNMDSRAYADADEAFRLATQHLPGDLIANLAQEVVRRLSFRMPALTPLPGYPSSEEVDRFTEALLSDEEDAADAFVVQARREGVEMEAIYLGYLAGASRRLGQMWEEDQLSFVAVSLGTGRLYRIIRGLRHAIAPVLLEGRQQTPALFVLTPDETHTLGIEMAADLFRRDGGDADVCVGQTHDEILSLAETRHYGVIVLVAHSDRVIPQLVQLSVALRIMQPLTPFALAGNLVDSNPEVAKMVEAELVVADIRSAIQDLRRITDHA